MKTLSLCGNNYPKQPIETSNYFPSRILFFIGGRNWPKNAPSRGHFSPPALGTSATHVLAGWRRRFRLRIACPRFFAPTEKSQKKGGHSGHRPQLLSKRIQQACPLFFAALQKFLRYTYSMAAPFVPSPLDCIGRNRFAFYPPIENAGPNEWLLGAGSRSEVQAVNALTGVEIWIARQSIGAVSDHTTVLTVGLRKALELRGGVLQPRVKRVIEIPPAVGDRLQIRRDQGPAAVVAIRLDDGKKSSINKAVVAIAVSSLLVALLAAWFSTAVHF